MKTAVSIPDDVFNEAEALARRSNISRSELYATALRALLQEDAKVTEELDRVYKRTRADQAVTSAARRTLARNEW